MQKKNYFRTTWMYTSLFQLYILWNINTDQVYPMKIYILQGAISRKFTLGFESLVREECKPCL